MMARRRPERDIIQSRWSVPFKRVIIISVFREEIQRSKKTGEGTFCRHRFRRRKSNIGYSTSLWLYLLPKYSPKVSANTCKSPETATGDVGPPTAATTDPSTDKLCLASLKKRSVTATATRRKVSSSHVRTKADNDTPRSSISQTVQMARLSPTNDAWQNSG